MNSVFMRPVPAIPFPMVDDRLEKHGLNLKRKRKGVVIAGQRGQLLARVRKGETYFELGRGQKAIDIVDALEVEYGVEVIDENDGRYSGKLDDVPPDMTGIVHGENNIVVAGPTGRVSISGRFMADWIPAAELADATFRSSDIRRMMLHGGGVDLADWFEFSSCALWLMNQSLKGDGAFVINLEKCVQREMIVIMMMAGFLRPVGHYYQMTIPHKVDIAVVEDMVADFLDADTVDREKYKVVTTNRMNGRQLAGQLRAQNMAIQDAENDDRGKVVMLSTYRKTSTAEWRPT